MAARVAALSITALVLGAMGCGSEEASSPPGSGAGTGGASGSAGNAGSSGSGGGSGGTAGSGGSSGTGAGGSGGSAAGSAGTGGGSGSGGAPDGGGAPRCPASVDGSAPVPSGATVSPVHAGHKFLEGPVWFAERGVLLFSDMDFGGGGAENVPPSIIYQLVPPSTVTPFIPQVGSNGLAIDAEQRLIACTHDERSVSRFDLDTKQRSTVVRDFGGSKFSSPNDAIVRSDGTVYFTDPTWQLGNRPREIQFKGVYRVAPGGAAELVSDSVGSPNGIALSPDESALYVTDDGAGAVLKFTVAADGSTTGGAKIADVGGADGMAVDCAGNLYVTSHEGIRVLTASGAPITTIAVPQKANNCTFGGTDGKTLYIAGRDTLYSVTLAVPGLP